LVASLHVSGMDNDDTVSATRRRALAGLAAALTAGTAGCVELGHRLAGAGEADATPEDRSFERLDRVAVYLDVDLSVPSEVQTTGSPDEADLLVLPDDTDVDAGQVADWLAGDRVVALLGEDAQATWLAWERSDAFAETFADGGYGRGDPAPQLLVGAAIGSQVSTYRTTWEGDPSDPEIVGELDEKLVDIEQRTPR
jgi:hypothetical protein